MDTSHEEHYEFLIIFRPVLFKMRNVSNIMLYRKSTHNLMFSNFLSKSHRLRDNVENTVESNRSKITVWLLRIVCWIPKVTNTHSEWVILPLQQWSPESISVLGDTYTACLVY